MVESSRNHISWLPHPVILSPLQIFSGLNSAILLGMAFDHYVAICSLFRYSSVLTPRTIVKVMVGIVGWSFSVILPIVFLVKHLPFCRTRTIPHMYCEHIGVSQISCANISINTCNGFAVPVVTIFSDLILIGISYTLILHAVFCLPSRDASQKGLSACGSHVSVILIFYKPAMFLVLMKPEKTSAFRLPVTTKPNKQ